MNEQLRNRLAEIAEDAPSVGQVLQTVRAGHQRRLHRRRWVAASAAALAVVVATVGVTTVLRPSADGTASVPTPIATTTTVTSTPGVPVVGERAVPSSRPTVDAKLVQFAGAVIRSPVAVPASQVSFDADGPDVLQGPVSFQADWLGQAPTVMQTLDDSRGTTGTGQVRGYLVTNTEPALTVTAPDGTVTSSSESIVIGGHAARLLTAPKGSYDDDTYATPAAARVVWQLPDHRWIRVWAVGEPRAALISFASSITDSPTVFPSNISPGLTLAGYSVATSTFSTFVSQMGGPGVSLCRSAVPVHADNSGCLNFWADIADGGFAQSVVSGSESDAEFEAGTTSVVVGDVRVQVNVQWQVAWTRWGAATIRVTGPAKGSLSSAALAALVATVRLAPDLDVRNQPNPVVESSLAEQSAQSAASAAATATATG